MQRTQTPPRRALSTSDRVLLARRSAGAWKGFPETGAKYIERIRGSRRLSRMMEPERLSRQSE